jgi:hypothetical protein
MVAKGLVLPFAGCTTISRLQQSEGLGLGAKAGG